MPGERIARRVELLLADARAALEAGERAEAHVLARAILALDPGNEDAALLVDGADQRLQMTLMFCDLVGSTALADRLDPEETSAILREYRLLCMEVVSRYGGFIEDRQGDGLLVRFGYPWVHEDDARRAVLSGLEIVRAVASHPLGLQVRIGIHTGLVVLDDGEVMGATPNEAARLQGLASPDSVVISDATYALVREHFDVRAQGMARLRGVSREVGVFVVVAARSGHATASAADLTPYAGRRGELALVDELWQHACGDDGAPSPPALLITGPAGIGKTRIAREATLAIGARDLVCRCSSYHAGTSLHPFAPVLATLCSIQPRDDSAQRLGKLRARLGDAGADGGVPDLPVLSAALGIDPADCAHPADVEPTKLRAMALHAVARLIRAGVADDPLLLLVEDLHWADESSLALIAILLSAPCPRLLVLMTARPDFAIPWPEELVRRLALQPLGNAELELMTSHLAEHASLDEDLRREAVARSDGIPLFLEELVRSGLAIRSRSGPECGADGEGSRVPDALRDPLLARLVVPGVDLALAQAAATIGIEINGDLLQRVSGLGDRPFQSKLANLVAARLVSVSDRGTIRFGHDLLREAAYETQRRSVRRSRHGHIADLLAEGPHDAGELALHLERAERIPEAIDALFAAAGADQALAAHQEAMTRLSRIVTLVERLPTGAPRLLHELTARQLRSFSATMVAGYAAPATAQDHARCVELCEHLGLGPALLPSLYLSWTYYLFRGDLDDAGRVWSTIQRLIADSDLPEETVALARSLKGIECFFRGRFAEAGPLLRGFVDDPHAAAARWPLPNDARAAVGAQLAVNLAFVGEHAAALAVGDDALAHVAGLGFPHEPFSAAFVTCHLAIVRMLAGDFASAAELAGETARLGDRHGFVMWSLIGSMQRLASQVHLGDAASLDGLATAVGRFRTLLSSELWAPYWLTQLAAAQLAAGRPEQAREPLDEALRVAAVTGSVFFSAETLRLRGTLRCDGGDDGGIVDLRSAVELATRQEATALRSRAAADLERIGARAPASP